MIKDIETLILELQGSFFNQSGQAKAVGKSIAYLQSYLTLLKEHQK